MRKCREFSDVQNGQRRIRNGLSHDSLRIFLKDSVNHVSGIVRIHKRAVDAQFFDGCRIQIEGAAIDLGRADDMVSCLAQIGNGIKIRRLTGRSQHGCHTAFQRRDLRRYRIIGGILQAGVKVALILQCEKSSHFVCGVIFKSGTLIDREHPRLPLLRLPSRLYADGIQSV